MIKKKKVFIVDDSISSRSYLSKKLQEAGFETFEAVNGREAYQKLKKESYDIMLLDLLMPDMNGLELLKIIQQEKINIPTMVVSADIQQTVQDECFALGAIDFLNKPINIEFLIGKLDENQNKY